MSQKDPTIVAALDGFSIAMFGRARSICLANHECVTCGGPAMEFKDEVSKREYQISGTCQSCQDKLFSAPEGDADGSYVNQDR